MTTPSRVKVLHVLHGLNMGGAETWLMELLRHWSKAGSVEMHFLATGGEPGVFDEEAVRLGARIHYLRYGRDTAMTFLRHYRSLLARERYDAIHDHADLTSGWHFLMGAGRLPPVRVAHVHNPLMHLRANYGVTPTRRLISAAGRFLVLRMATHVCGTSSKALVEYGFDTRSRQPEISVLHCGFDISTFNSPREPDRRSVLAEFGLEPHARIVLFAGRIDRDLQLDHPRNHKNSWLAVLTARAAAKRSSHVYLLMAGAGDKQRRDIEQRIAAWGMTDRIRMLGVRQDIGRLMRAADVLLFPSAEEGLGMVAVEAQAAATPVLASWAIPAEAVIVPEIFHRESPNATPEVWAAKLLDVLDEPRPEPADLFDRLQSSSFSIANSACRLENIYAGKHHTSAPFETRPRGASPDRQDVDPIDLRLSFASAHEIGRARDDSR